METPPVTDKQLVDVIVPLPLAGTFTYAVPEERVGHVAVGCRVIVPFGPRRLQTGVVVKLHHTPPAEYELKEVTEVLDEAPVVTASQLRLWEWMADYYLCTVGEVMKAALPSGMKLESESVVVLNPDFEAEGRLSGGEQKILDALAVKPEQNLQKLQAATGLRTLMNPVKALLERGALCLKEEVKQSYKPRRVACVKLAEAYFDEDRLNEVFSEMKRSPRQQDLLTKYLEMSEAAAALTLRNPKMLARVERAELLKQTVATPAVLSALLKRGVLEQYDYVVERADAGALPETLVATALSEAQQRAADEIRAAFGTKDVCLLHGVTGGGKTEVYIHLIREVLERGGRVLYLVPEIALTTQLTRRLRRVFGGRMGVYHSRLPDAERVELWKKQCSASPYDLVLGVRSSVLLPFSNLQLVIVDEEHEPSFKQEDPAPRYHARNVALVLARMTGAKTLLGTATPSLETYYHSETGKYARVELTTRYGGVQLPEIEVVDIGELRRKRRMSGPFSPPLLLEMRRALANREQIILFQNRRGFAPLMECPDCRWVPRCPSCDVSLTYHKRLGRLTCHYCGHTCLPPVACPACGQTRLLDRGFGTEKIEDEIGLLFPEARVARMDLDTTRTRQAYDNILNDFQQGRTDILVGTQMVTKGLDFERVRVVGILDADTMLNQPDFRSYERAFQMMSQVAGRAGRRTLRGKVILQTKSPDLPVVMDVVRHDYTALYHDQLEERRAFAYPPFRRLVYLYLKHREEPVLNALAAEAAARMRAVFGSRVLGPDAPPVGRVQFYYIRKMMLKVEPEASMPLVREALRRLAAELQGDARFRAARIYFDVDPV